MKTSDSKSAKSGGKSVESLLGNLLADTYALLGQTQFAHWNVQGHAFFSLHPFLETQYDELFQAVDVIAERLRALGALSPGGLKTLASLSTITELDVKAHPSEASVDHRKASHEILLATAIELPDRAGDSGDKETEDLVVGRLRVHEKTIWMFRAYLKTP